MLCMEKTKVLLAFQGCVSHCLWLCTMLLMLLTALEETEEDSDAVH